jgi:Nucleotidyltransferase of unknown function (DUF6036)
MLPADWQTRALVRRVEVENRVVTAVAPCPEDIVVSKLARLDKKDRTFIEAFDAVRPLDAEVIEKRYGRARWIPRSLTEPWRIFRHSLAAGPRWRRKTVLAEVGGLCKLSEVPRQPSSESLSAASDAARGSPFTVGPATT